MVDEAKKSLDRAWRKRETRAGIKQSMGAWNRVGTEFSYRPASLRMLVAWRAGTTTLFLLGSKLP